ncbi:MAG: 3-oxoacyl-ACP synthase [Mucilaginibacter sp.]|nr:3-oxoacyl-ACP synthase [Mucilaginibacter sp.]
MKLVGIDCQIPSNKIANADIIDLVKYYSTPTFSDLKGLEVFVRKYLSLTGIESRFWREKNEKPLDLIKQAVDNALKMAHLQLKDIDLVIYSSIDRGFIEPANSNFICKALGLNNIRNFDIVDACMGWASAVQVAASFLNNSSHYHSILIVNAEFPMDEKGAVLPSNFTIKQKSELQWKSASFTMGEAASASIFQKDDKSTLFEFIEDHFQSELCTITLPNSEKYRMDAAKKYFPDDLQFFADSALLLQKGMLPAINVLQNLLGKLDYTPKMVFPHSISSKVIQDAALNAGVQASIYSTFSKLGNLATASVPSGITKALLNNLLKPNEKAIAWIASAGMKYAAFEVQL